MSKLIEGSSSSLMQLCFNNGDGISMSLGERQLWQPETETLQRGVHSLSPPCCAPGWSNWTQGFQTHSLCMSGQQDLLQLRVTRGCPGDLQNPPGGPLRRNPCHPMSWLLSAPGLWSLSRLSTWSHLDVLFCISYSKMFQKWICCLWIENQSRNWQGLHSYFY